MRAGTAGQRAGLCARTLRTTAVVGVLVAWGLWSHYGAVVAASFGMGVLLGMVLLAAIDFVVQRTVRAPGEDPPVHRWPYLVVHVGKFVVAGAVLYALCGWSQVSYGALAAGYGLPIAVMVLKLAGMDLNRKTGAGRPQSGQGGEK